MKLRKLKDCAVCHAPFYTRSAHVVNCSKKCSIAYRNRREANPIYRKMQSAKRIAVKNGKNPKQDNVKPYSHVAMLQEIKTKHHSDNITNIKGQAGMSAYTLRRKLTLLQQQQNNTEASNNV